MGNCVHGSFHGLLVSGLSGQPLEGDERAGYFREKVQEMKQIGPFVITFKNTI